MKFNDFNKILNRLDAESLEALADTCDILAHQARILVASHNLKATQRAEINKRFESCGNTPQLVAQKITDGSPVDNAIQAVAAETGIPIETIRLYWRRWLRSPERQRQRTALILALASRGATNAQIGERVGLHANSVSRIIREQIRKTAKLRPPTKNEE